MNSRVGRSRMGQSRVGQSRIEETVLSIGPSTCWSSGGYSVESRWVFYHVQVEKSVEILLGFSGRGFQLFLKH